MITASPKILFSTSRRRLKQKRARRINDASAGFLSKLAAETIGDRLSAVTRQFPHAIDIFSQFDFMQETLDATSSVGRVKRYGGLTLRADQALNQPDETDIPLPFEPESFHLICSLFGLHWRNDLPNTLKQIRSILVPDGLFLAALPGDRTLQELRSCLLEAESQLMGTASLRIDPFGEVRQYGDLLQQAGFGLPVVDSELVTVRYGSLLRLANDLRAMGASSSLAHPSSSMSAKLFQRTEELYHERYGDADGKFKASFEIVYLLGWGPHETQQKPLKPGSGQYELKDFL